MKTRLIQTKWGFYQAEILPSQKELQAYYRDKYYQEGRGSYAVNYDREEMEWFQLKADIVRTKAEQVVSRSKLNVLDVGCGEGWLMNSFSKANHLVQGIDFSIAGVRKFHPHLEQCFSQGDLFDDLKGRSDRAEQYDVVSCCNVVEHVLDPVGLLLSLKKLTRPDGCLILTVPNDFSLLHQHLLNNKYIESEWWVCYPDHISYFNKSSMLSFLADHDLSVHAVLADNPIDLNLLNDNSNYVKDPSKGKATHRFRVRLDNFLASIDRKKMVELYSVLGDMGVGRNLIYFARPSN